jgi:hypothetical protein
LIWLGGTCLSSTDTLFPSQAWLTEAYFDKHLAISTVYRVTAFGGLIEAIEALMMSLRCAMYIEEAKKERFRRI